MRPSASLSIALLAFSVGAAVHAQTNRDTGPWQTYDMSNGEWRSYAGDIRGTKYSPLDQIDASNFNDLEVAWDWMSVDDTVSRTTPVEANGGHRSTPSSRHSSTIRPTCIEPASRPTGRAYRRPR